MAYLNKYLLCTSFFFSFISSALFADSLWSNGMGKLAQGFVAATFNINNSGSQVRTSTQTQLNFYTDIACSVAQHSTNAGGAVVFLANHTAYANAGSVYSLIDSTGWPPADMNSIQVIPKNALGNVFTTTPCFSVRCSAATSRCEGTTVASVALQ